MLASSEHSGGGGGAGPTVSIAAYDRPSPLVRVGDRRRRRHHTRYQSPISPCHVNLQSERSGGGGIVPRVGSDEGERAGLGASGAGGGEGGSLRSALRRRRWSNARIQFVSGGGARADDPSSSSTTRQPAAKMSLSNSQQRTAGTPTCKTAGRNTEDMSGRQKGGGDVVLCS